MEKFSVDNILKVNKIENEFELEFANTLYNKLRLLAKEDSSLKPLRKHLAILIEAYESEHWADENKVTDEQLINSDHAEKIITFHNQFIQQRKTKIVEALKKNDLIQNDLASLLGHRKNYMSELINGVRPFSQEDLIVIHRMLGIKLDYLIIPIIKEPTAIRIRSVVKKLNKPKFKLKDKDLILEFA